MINKFTIALSVVLIALLGYFVYQKYFINSKIHYHAGFRIYNDGVLLDFSGPEYMSLKPCTTATVTTNGDDQEEKAHLHDRIGYVVHIHRAGTRWSDMFTNIHYPLSATKPFVAYINGKKAQGFPDLPVNPYDSLVLLIGKHGNPSQYFSQAVTKKMIQTVEKKSESCGS